MNKWMDQILDRRGFAVLLIVSFLSIGGYGVQHVLVPVQMNEVGTNLFWSGVFLSLYGLPRAFMNIIGGHLCGRFSITMNMLLSIFLFGVLSTLLIGISQSSVAIGIWRMLMAIGLSWAMTAMVAYAAEVTASSIRGTAFGIQKMVTWGGLSLVSLLAPIWLVQWNLPMLMVVMSAIAGVGVILVYLYIFDLEKKEYKFQKEERDRSSFFSEWMPNQKKKWSCFPIMGVCPS